LTMVSQRLQPATAAMGTIDVISCDQFTEEDLDLQRNGKENIYVQN
jgi:hypothetical protein